MFLCVYVWPQVIESLKQTVSIHSHHHCFPNRSALLRQSSEAMDLLQLLHVMQQVQSKDTFQQQQHQMQAQLQAQQAQQPQGAVQNAGNERLSQELNLR